MLKAQLQNPRLRLTDGDRRRLAARGAALGRRLLAQVATIVTADTILRWHRQPIARKWTYPRRRLGLCVSNSQFSAECRIEETLRGA